MLDPESEKINKVTIQYTVEEGLNYIQFQTTEGRTLQGGLRRREKYYKEYELFLMEFEFVEHASLIGLKGIFADEGIKGVGFITTDELCDPTNPN